MCRRPTTAVLFALVVTTGAIGARAGFDLPAHVFRLADLERAVALASRQEKALAFVLTDEHTRRVPCQAASRDAFEALRRGAVLVYVDRTRADRLPLRIRLALSSARAGRKLPKVIVTDRRLRTIIAVVPYARQPRRKRLLDEAVDLMKRHTRRKGSRLELDLKPARIPVQRVRPSAEPARAQPAPLGTVQAQQEAAPAAGAAEPRARPIVELRWRGELAPGPADSLAEFFRARGLPMRGRCRATSCRFEATAPVAAETFQTDLQIFLNRLYRVDRIRAEDNRVSAWLSEQADDGPVEADDKDATVPVESDPTRP